MKNYVKVMLATLFLVVAATVAPSVSEAAATAAPTGLKQTDASESSVKFSWDAVVDAECYYVQYSDGVTWSEGVKASSPNDYYLRGRSPGKSYFVRVYTDSMNNEPSAVLEVVTKPDLDEVGTPTITSVTDTAIAFSWAPVTGATSYEITSRYTNLVLNLTLPSTTTSTTVTGLQPLTWYGLNIAACRTSASGFKAITSEKSVSYTQTLATLVTPATMSTSNMGVKKVTDNSVSFYIENQAQTVSGFEVEIRNVKTGKAVKKVASTNSYSETIQVGKNTPYKYRVRMFAQSGATKLYGGWSGYRYFTLHTITGKRHYKFGQSYATVKLKWSKVKGAKGYTIYISTKENSGFKKVKSLGKNAKKVTLTRTKSGRLKVSKRYYFRIIPKVKDGKKTIKNDLQMTNYTL